MRGDALHHPGLALELDCVAVLNVTWRRQLQRAQLVARRREAADLVSTAVSGLGSDDLRRRERVSCRSPARAPIFRLPVLLRHSVLWQAVAHRHGAACTGASTLSFTERCTHTALRRSGCAHSSNRIRCSLRCCVTELTLSGRECAGGIPADIQ